jgi:hypothetical protein
MRYYLGTCEYKWSHKDTHMERMWVMREVGTDLFKTVESNNWEWTLLRSDSQSLPGDVYLRCDIYVDIPDSKQATYFVLKYPKAKYIEAA